MTSVFGADGKNIPCTVIEAGPCVVTQLRTVEKDGYAAVQLAYDETTEKHASAPLKGHFAKAGTTPHRKLVEFKADFKGELKLGDTLTVADIFEGVEYVDVVGTSKGKGFQGVTKRWGVKLLSHRNSKHRRGIGNLGPKRPGYVRSTVPGSGQMGYHQRTELNKKIMKVGADGKEVNPKGGFLNYGEIRNTYVLVHGSVPGPTKRLIRFRDAARIPAKADTSAAEITYVSTQSQQGA